MNKYASLSSDAKDEHDTRHLADSLVALKNRIDKEGSVELKSQWFAQQAGLSDDYNSMYSLLSNDVHVNVKSIDDLVNRDDNDNILLLKIGPDDSKRQLMLLLMLVGKYGILSAESCLNVLKLDTHDVSSNVRRELQGLIERLKSFAGFLPTRAL